MEPEFQIVQVLNTSKSDGDHGLIFKVVWSKNAEIAYMQFDMARKKYPLVVLDYLISKIRKRPSIESETPPAYKNLLVTQMGGRLVKSELTKSKDMVISQVDKFFTYCSFCESKSTHIKMLDYDALVDADNNLAYPVYFKLKKGDKPKLKKVQNQQIK